eukprot:11195017-Lingulodinium_polyedra.AAC.1
MAVVIVYAGAIMFVNIVGIDIVVSMCIVMTVATHVGIGAVMTVAIVVMMIAIVGSTVAMVVFVYC